MTIYRLGAVPIFPDPEAAEPDGLLAVGGDLSPARLLNAYRLGIFPWFGAEEPILWWSPPQRALFLPGQEHLSRRTRRALRHCGFEIRVDTCFADVIHGCAEIPRANQPGTWITPAMREAYLALHQTGFAHSFETFKAGELVGGLYGVSLGAAFFGESMFSRVDYASRAAFAALCAFVWHQGFQFIDGQVPNDNLTHLGAEILPRSEFLDRLGQANDGPVPPVNQSGATWAAAWAALSAAEAAAPLG